MPDHQEALDAALSQIDRAFGHNRTYPADAIFLVIRTTGQEDYREETPVVAFKTVEAAKDFISQAYRQHAEALAKFPQPSSNFYRCGATEGTEEEALWIEREDNMREVMTLDPDAADDSDAPSYRYEAVRLLASVDTLPKGQGPERA